MTVKSSGALLLPDDHLMLRGSSGHVRELGRGDRDGYAWSYVGGESKWRGRLNWTVGRSPSAREACEIPVYRNLVGKGLMRVASRVESRSRHDRTVDRTSTILTLYGVQSSASSVSAESLARPSIRPWYDRNRNRTGTRPAYTDTQAC